MGTEPGDFPEYVASEPRVWSEETYKRGSEGDPVELNAAARKQLSDLLPFYPLHIGVPGVIDRIVIP